MLVPLTLNPKPKPIPGYRLIFGLPDPGRLCARAKDIQRLWRGGCRSAQSLYAGSLKLPIGSLVVPFWDCLVGF